MTRHRDLTFMAWLPVIDYPVALLKKEPRGCIVNTDPEHRPGKHWIALWTECGNVCEVMDSYGLPLDTYKTSKSLQHWIKTHWKYLISN